MARAAWDGMPEWKQQQLTWCAENQRLRLENQRLLEAVAKSHAERDAALAILREAVQNGLLQCLTTPRFGGKFRKLRSGWARNFVTDVISEPVTAKKGGVEGS